MHFERWNALQMHKIIYIFQKKTIKKKYVSYPT